jgi:DNA-binding GntR family transcriptional regulator
LGKGDKALAKSVKSDNSKKRSLSEIAYLAMSEWLVSGELEPEEPIVEADIASWLGMSRTPVREAIVRLQKEGLVKVIPRRGVFVNRVSWQELQEVFAVREALEGMAARIAAGVVNEEKLADFGRQFDEADAMEDPDARVQNMYETGNRFHEWLVVSCGNKMIIDAIDGYMTITHVACHASAKAPGRIEEAFNEHRKIFESLRRRDPDGVEKAMRFHISNTHRSLYKAQ